MADQIEEMQLRADSLKVRMLKITKQIHTLTQERETLEHEHEQLRHQIALKQLNSAQNCTGLVKYSTEKCFTWSLEVDRIRREIFNVDKFRPLQLLAINAYLDGRDVILIMPTGAGKSLVYQLPAFMQTPPHAGQFTLVVSPLVSLMTDQALSLQRLGIQKSSVSVLDANTSTSDQKEIYLDITGDSSKNLGSSTRLLYVTPEKLAKSKRLMNLLEKAYKRSRLARIAIDEVHCVSQWGHDFRPDYKFLHVLRSQFPNTPILGLTATASVEVVVDVQKMLGLEQSNCLVLRTGYNRPNLHYEVISQAGSISMSHSQIISLLTTKFLDQSGIIYCLSQKDTEILTKVLNEGRISAAFYHANMSPEYRLSVHHGWSENKIKVIVATIAFGMGIDKPDVRFVIHLSASKSVENYYQESGRAGRDGQASHILLFWRLSDLFRLATMVFSEQTGISKLMQMLEYAIESCTCRRKMLAIGLGDNSWSTTDCSYAKCDNCSNQTEAVSMDIRNVLKVAEEILKAQMDALNHRITGAKLVDLLTRHSDVEQVLKMNNVPISRGQRLHFCEYFVAWCLLKSYLKMDFHFTPYTTIAYIAAAKNPPVLSLLPLPKWLFTKNNPDYSLSLTPLMKTKKRPAQSPCIDIESD